MKYYRKSRFYFFVIISIEFYLPIPTWIGNYVVWVNVWWGGGGIWSGGGVVD